MTMNNHHTRRVRCYEFAHVVDWEAIIEDMDDD